MEPSKAWVQRFSLQNRAGQFPFGIWLVILAFEIGDFPWLCVYILCFFVIYYFRTFISDLDQRACVDVVMVCDASVEKIRWL